MTEKFFRKIQRKKVIILLLQMLERPFDDSRHGKEKPATYKKKRKEKCARVCVNEKKSYLCYLFFSIPYYVYEKIL